MQKYIDQLLRKIENEALSIISSRRYVKSILQEELSLVSFHQIIDQSDSNTLDIYQFDIDIIEFPPADKLEVGQCKLLVESLERLFESVGCYVEMPYNVPYDFQYSLYLKMYKSGIKANSNINNSWINDFCNGCTKSCELKQYCPCLKYEALVALNKRDRNSQVEQ